MESIFKSDIFFFITSISVILFTIIFIISGFYFIKIMKNFSDISEILKNTVKKTEDGISEIGERITESLIFSFIFGKKKKSKK